MSHSLLSFEKANLFPKIIWWHFSPCGDLGKTRFSYRKYEVDN